MNAPLNVLSLFAGIGGLDLGLERAGMVTVGQVEIDDYCRRVLAKHWPNVPRHEDVRTAADWWLSTERPRVDVICGGFPCQDISVAGKRAGIIDGKRSSLWTYFAHTIRELRPRYVLVENVAAILVRGLDVVAADLAEIGYDLRWDCIPAAALGAHHRRDRWFGIAYPNSNRLRLEPITEPERGGTSVVAVDGGQGELADTHRAARTTSRSAGETLFGPGPLERSRRRSGGLGLHWAVEPGMGRVAHGVPDRMDRLRVLGNAVVPQVAEYVGQLIVEHDLAAAAA